MADVQHGIQIRSAQIFSVLTLIVCIRGTNIDAPYRSINRVVEEYALPELPYSTDALEPYIDSATVNVHHKGHHQAYTNKMNTALKEWRTNTKDELSQKSILTLLSHLGDIPLKYRSAIQNNGGGYVNHAFYWAVMGPAATEADAMTTEARDLVDEISQEYGDFTTFKEVFTNAAKTLFGSGYVWLSRSPSADNSRGDLLITATVNQDSPIAQGLKPILVIDVWEHAYYLKYQNLRPKYVDAWWSVVNWHQVAMLDTWWRTEAYSSHDEL